MRRDIISTKWFTISLLASCLLLGVVLIPRTYNVEPIKSVPETTQDGRTAASATSRGKTPPRAISKPKTPIRQVVQDLKHLEFRGKADIVVLDSNGKFSFSCLQFQRATFLQYAARYGYPTSTQAMMDCGVQTELAVKMLNEDWSNIYHWYNSAKKLSLI